ncbi:hypothetical protein BDW02DRAFT_564458 [Decorospora gaudefroyi]|uniref:F-box domain-containing protein n=1 Tax=Decorospora gaudefroyi TaxID=184978 RepID=A0A6A5KYJ3_9PLEO|nr:hypothetical protein BDW02DRAFT_564458 [Decorospora gaudefroyi]
MTAKALPHSVVRPPLCPSLPAEIWINIFRHHPDLGHLWTTCRRVSPSLRACAEYAFSEHFLKDVYIDFHLEKYNLGGKSKRPEVCTTFARRENEWAWYKDLRPDISAYKRIDQVHYIKVTRRWEENVKGWKAEMPNYTIHIGGLVNDTALPGLQIDTVNRDIRVRWKEMLSLFFREHERSQLLKAAFRTRTAKKVQANNALLMQGKTLMPFDCPPLLSTAEAEILKQIRRMRLKEYYGDDEQMVWAIDSLNHFEQYDAGNARALRINPDLPGAGLGERWFGSLALVQGLYLDEWSCVHRIGCKGEEVKDAR